MNPRLIQIFGPQFVVDDVRDLELLTDLLSISRDHLNVMFAVASYLEQVPDGSRHMRPALRERLNHSLIQLQHRTLTGGTLAGHTAEGESLTEPTHTPRR